MASVKELKETIEKAIKVSRNKQNPLKTKITRK